MDFAERFHWNRPVHLTMGGAHRLRGLAIFHDFNWYVQFGNGRAQFRGGQKLAESVKRRCPDGKAPALLLTDQEGRAGLLLHDEWYVIVVNIRDYLLESRGNPAETYIASLRKELPLRTATESSVPPGESPLVKATEVMSAIVTRLQEHSEIRPVVIEALLRMGGPELLMNGREREFLKTAMRLLGQDAWESILSTGLSLPAGAAMQRIWALRADALARFREHLRDDDWAEHDWQTFFEKESWIFGLALDCQFLHLVEGQPYLGGKRFTGSGGTVGDFLMATGGTLRFTVLVEIKKPNTRLLSSGDYRNDAFPPTTELAGAVAQLHRQAAKWATESQQLPSLDVLDREHVYTYQPKSILIIGRTDEFLAEGLLDRPRLYAFESYRRSLVQPDVMTFDELLTRAEQTVAGENVRP